MVHLRRDSTAVHETRQRMEVGEEDQSVNDLRYRPVVLAICQFLEWRNKQVIECIKDKHISLVSYMALAL